MSLYKYYKKVYFEYLLLISSFVMIIITAYTTFLLSNYSYVKQFWTLLCILVSVKSAWIHHTHDGLRNGKIYCNYVIRFSNPCCVNLSTVYVQIFEARKFHGCHKFSIFVILFLRMTYQSNFAISHVFDSPHGCSRQHG